MTTNPAGVLPLAEATGRVRADHEILLARVRDLTADELAARCRPASGPLGDFCDLNRVPGRAQ